MNKEKIYLMLVPKKKEDISHAYFAVYLNHIYNTIFFQ